MKKIITNSFRETQEIGQKFAKTLNNGNVLCLYGNLGSGKTSFVQGLARGLGIDKRIISPTFIIIRSYILKKSNFYHVDLYRISGSNDLISLGLPELIDSKENILAIEWAEKLEEFLPRNRIDLRFEQIGDNTRKISIGRHE